MGILKTSDDLLPFVLVGYTFYTVDPSAYVDNAADTDPLPVLREKARGLDWDGAAALHLNQDLGFGAFDEETLLRALLKSAQMPSLDCTGA